jgi:hypothetical protein
MFGMIPRTFLVIVVAAVASANGMSMEDVIAAPDKFDGKVVRVAGYLVIEMEGDAVYLREEDYMRNPTNGLFLRFPGKNGEPTASQVKLHRSYVIAEGTFRAKEKGHAGLYAGVIEVNRLSPSRSRSRPAARPTGQAPTVAK